MTTDATYYRFALKVFSDFSTSIAVPAVVFALIGHNLDERLGTKPWMLIGFLALAFIISGFVLVKKANIYRDRYIALNKSTD